jgi:hypothetical protein
LLEEIFGMLGFIELGNNQNHIYTYLLITWVKEPGGSMPYLKALSNYAYPEPKQPNFSQDTYLFKVHYNIVLPSTPRIL